VCSMKCQRGGRGGKATECQLQGHPISTCVTSNTISIEPGSSHAKKSNRRICAI
jgi:hypothetical protein